MTLRKALLLSVLMFVLALVAAACGAAPTATPGCVQPGANGILESVPCGAGGTVLPTPSAAVTPSATSTSPVAAGEQLAQSEGCTACHSTDGTNGIGPTWKGLYNSQVTLTNGSTVTANVAYLHESIVDPDAQIVKGFQPNVMPATFSHLSAQQINDLIAYIESLK